MGGVVSAGVDNDELVDKLKEADYIRNVGVEKVFRLVDRGYYLTKDNQKVAYRDNAFRSGNLHLSAPCIYAQVMEGLQLDTGMSFLNIGSGTGYLSTMAGLLIGPNGVNHGIELHSDLVEYARERLSWFIGNTGTIDVSFFREPQFSQGNALCLGEDVQLYDRVYCGASCPSSHEDYMKNLIKVNGILVMPRNDKLLKITRLSKAAWSTESLLPVSFSSLIVPDQSFRQENVQLPSVQIISLQELAREVIRSIFRSRIEIENENLKFAFVHSVPTPPPEERKQCGAARVVNTFPPISISDTEYDSDGSEHEREIVYPGHRLQASQLSAFLELTRSLARNRSTAERDRDEARGGEMEDDEDRSNQSDTEEMFVDDEEDLFEMINRVTREEESEPAQGSDDGDQSFNKSDRSTQTPREEEAEREKPKGEGEEETNKVGSTSIVVTNEDGVEDEQPTLNEEASSSKCGQETRANGAKSPNDTNSSALASSNPLTEDEEMVEVNEASPQGSTSGGKTRLKRDPKKREKFDSGIVEDLDTTISMEDSSSSCSFHSRSNSSDSSEEEEEDAEGSSRGLKASHPHAGRGWGAQCRGRRPLWKRREENRRKRRHIKYGNESRTDSKTPIDKYTRLMREKISLLPLPAPLKVYVNYNRPL